MSELGKYARYVPGKSGTNTVISQRGAVGPLDTHPILIVSFVIIGFMFTIVGLFFTYLGISKLQL